MGRRRIVISGADGQAFTRGQRLASTLVRHPYTKTSLSRGAAINAAGALLWALGAVITGSVVWTGVLMLGTLFLGLRVVANIVMIGVLPGDDDSQRSEDAESS